MNPPLPHQPQAHFYGAPDLNFGVPSRASGLKPGTRGYHCSIESLNPSGLGLFKQIDSLVISGYEGGLDVYGVSRSGLDKIFSIDNLRGGVYSAKILPWTTQSSSQYGFPLVAIVLHGPVIPSDTSDSEYTAQAQDAVPIQKNESIRGSPSAFPSSPQPDGRANSIMHYQTTVEIYSLATKKHVGTLLCLPQVLLSMPVSSPGFTRPPPSGALSITADAGTILVTSGTSGEVWIYRQTNLDHEPSLGFRCIGKVWTSIHLVVPKEPPTPSEFPDSRGHFGEPTKVYQQYRTPLLSLKGRWLAYSPSRNTSQVCLRAVVPTQNASTAHIASIKPPGLATYAPPQIPVINCGVDMPEEEQLFKRVAREAAQMTYDGAKWVSDQGIQAFKNYWNKPSSSTQSHAPNSGGQNWQSTHQPQPELGHTFPPTHGESLKQNSSNTEPILISILDLDKLASYRGASTSSLPHPMSTFKTPSGCSFISFSPSGLALFTASGDGKLQFVWDLMRIQHTKSSVLQAPHLASLQGQHVRQVALFTRMSPCNIVDVVWTTPHGERIAVITANNTSHFLNMPSSAFAWPPMRRRVKAVQPQSSGPFNSGEGTTLLPLATRAWNFAGPLMPRPRVMSGPGLSGISAAAVTTQGGKALASGISKSFGAASETFERFYKSGDNKLHGNSSGAIIRSAKWTRAQEKDSLCCLLDGISDVMINTYRIKQRKSKSKSGKFHLYIGSKPLSFKLPSIPDHRIPLAVQRIIDHEDDLDLEEKDNEVALWGLEQSSVVKADLGVGNESSIPQAEIESNAPYQPFHTDRRVALHVYSTSPQQNLSPSASVLLNPISKITIQEATSIAGDAPWVFGRPLNTVKLDIGSSQVDEDDFDSAEDHRALPSSAMERVTTKIPEVDEGAEQIVVTTRRRKGAARSTPNTQSGLDDDGFFEDDCEVLDFASQRV
jgi:WD40 repeat protein